MLCPPFFLMKAKQFPVLKIEKYIESVFEERRAAG
jgi:hypothetical protein